MSEVHRLALEGLTAGEIHREFPESPTRPSLRTIYRIIEDVMPPDPSGSWAPMRGHVALNLVLPVLARVVEATNGRRASLTNAEAERIQTLREAVADLPPWETYILAGAYVTAEYQKADSEPLDMLLAFAPWRNIEHAERYFAALNRGWIQPPDAYTLQIAMLAIPATHRRPGIIPSRLIDEDKTPETWAYHQRFFFAPQEATE
ncbi:MAG: hypothetical protein Q7T33_14200 [Dehalococcoidia bacterium]|nr:hypothetical protein [Dehalococcoidia bacterium]